MVIIGDVHANLPEYKQRYYDIIKGLDQSIALGDLGFKDEHDYHLSSPYSKNHRILFGNHDHYPYVYRHHSMGDWFIDGNIMYIRGAWTRRRGRRVKNVHWFPEEEQMSDDQWGRCLKSYGCAKPEIVISHEVPCGVNIFHTINKTSERLQDCFDINKPNVWIFGHHHTSIDKVINGVRFKCLNILETFDLDIL